MQDIELYILWLGNDKALSKCNKKNEGKSVLQNMVNKIVLCMHKLQTSDEPPLFPNAGNTDECLT